MESPDNLPTTADFVQSDLYTILERIKTLERVVEKLLRQTKNLNDRLKELEY